jgi:lipid II:glycine glycyltransferase (peptidoglycan interpeptide bridge formation enzyme)
MSLLDAQGWMRYLTANPQAHILQSAAWGELKSAFGWQPERVQVGAAGAQVLFRKLPFGLSIAYLPKGPLGTGWERLWPEIDRLCRARGAIVLKVEPDGWEKDEAALAAGLIGFRSGGVPVQPRRTVVVSLEGPEGDWLERMKQKTRYNIRLAERKQVRVCASSDVNAFYALMQMTGSRDGFGVHSLAYYARAYTLFAASGKAALLMAEYESRPLAGLMVFCAGQRAWYLYGASSDEERSRMPTYLLQWEAMRWAAAQGCTQYDLWGVPDCDEAELEAQFERRQDGLWGVYRFKRGFGGQLLRAAQTWEKVYIPAMYSLYRWWIARRGEAA